MTEDGYLLTLIEEFTGESVLSTIWDPLVAEEDRVTDAVSP